MALISVKVTKRRAHQATHPNTRVIIDELQPRVKSIPFLYIKIWLQNPESTPKKNLKHLNFEVRSRSYRNTNKLKKS
jgi:hypothetical protein